MSHDIPDDVPDIADTGSVMTSRAFDIGDFSADSHDRVRHDTVSKAGDATLRVAGRLRHIGVGRTYARSRVLMLVHDLHVRVVDAATGELVRELSIDPRRDYQPRQHAHHHNS